MSLTTVAKNVCPRLKSAEPGKPAFDISAELLEDLLGLGFTYLYTRIAHMLEYLVGLYQEGSKIMV